MLFRRKMFKNRFNIKILRRIIITIIIVSLLYIFNLADNIIENIVTEITIKNAEETINLEVNKVVNNIITNENINYSTFITLQNHSDNVNSIIANSENINKFKSDIIIKTENELNKHKSLKTVVQLGSLTSSAILSNRGPDIPVYFDFYCVVNANITDDLKSAGINQSVHSIKLVVLTEYCIIFNNDEYKNSISTDYIVGENLIIGNVPQLYGNLYGLSTEKEE